MNTHLRGWRILDDRIITRRRISQTQTRSLLYTVELEYISHVHMKHMVLYHGHMSARATGHVHQPLCGAEPVNRDGSALVFGQRFHHAACSLTN
jgi:hypothetical protein